MTALLFACGMLCAFIAWSFLEQAGEARLYAQQQMRKAIGQFWRDDEGNFVDDPLDDEERDALGTEAKRWERRARRFVACAVPTIIASEWCFVELVRLLL